jgi:opacity protein-like surface antigen
MRKLVLLCACMVLLSIGAFAQKGEAYFGYSFLTNGKSGWNGELGYNLGKVIIAEGDLGGYYRNNDHIHSFMAGVKVQAPARRGFTPWGHFILGGAHVSGGGNSDTAYAWALGAGVDGNLSSKVGLRLGADALHTNFYNDGDLHLRLGAGLVYRF